MTDSLLLPICLNRLEDANGKPFEGVAYVYDAGTTDEKNVYTDLTLATAAANPIESDGGGWFDPRYIGTGSYKLVIKNKNGSLDPANWTTVKTADNLPGALDTSGFSNDEAIPITPVVSITSDYVLLAANKGNVIDADPTGGNITITLLSAVTAGDDFRLTVKHTGTSNSVILSTVSSQTIDGESTYTLGSQNESVTIVSDGANWLITETALVQSSVIYPPGFLYGLTLTNGPSDTTNDITVAAGSCRDSSNTVNMDISSALTKQIDASWVAGSAAGGRSSSGLSDTTWHIFVIAKAAGADADVLFHDAVDPTSALPTDYLYYRRIGSVVRASSAILRFYQFGDKFRLVTPVLDLSVTGQGTTTATRTMASMPTGLIMEHVGRWYGTCSTGLQLRVYSVYETDSAVSTTASGLMNLENSASGGDAAAELTILVNTSAELLTRALQASTTVRGLTLGWNDHRGRLS